MRKIVGLSVLTLTALLFMAPAQAMTPEDTDQAVHKLFGGFPPEGKMGRKSGSVSLNGQETPVTIVINKSPFERDGGKMVLSVGTPDPSSTDAEGDECFLIVVDVGLTGTVEGLQSGRFCFPSKNKTLDRKVFDKLGGDQNFYDAIITYILESM